MPWPQDAYVGQKVVCINAGFIDGLGRAAVKLLKVGEVYTINRVDVTEGTLWFGLEEHAYLNLPHDGWLPSRFRPAQSTDTGMAILRGLLRPNKVREDA